MNHLWTPWRMTYLKDSDQPKAPDHCVFCHKVAADDDDEMIPCRSQYVYVTLNLYPYNNGHLLIVPYEHVADITDLSPEAAADFMQTAQLAVRALRQLYHPQAFNMGINLGAAAGAGIAAHLHMHIVPRWAGDTNYMTVIGETRVIPDLLENTYRQLKAIWPTIRE